MTGRPIIFSAPMVRALLDGRKTQTRRVLKRKGYDLASCPRATLCDGGLIQFEHPRGGPYTCVRAPCAPGDRLWVREAHSLHDTHGQGRTDGKRWGPWGGLPTTISPDGTQIAYYREGFDRSDPSRWRPSIHMPRWASRLTLDVTDVRVQRLQEISEEDIASEGAIDSQGFAWSREDAARATPHGRQVLRGWFSVLWDTLHGAGSWDANPWVVAISFNVRRENIAAKEAGA